MDHHGRREKLAQFIVQENLDGFLVTNPINVTYLTGFSGDTTYFLAGKDRMLLVSDARYAEQLKEECPGLEVHIRPPSIRITPAAAAVLQKFGWREIGVESSHLPLGEFVVLRDHLPAASWKLCDDVVERLRMKKDAGEQAAIREAIAVAERSFARFRASLRPQDTEKRLSDRMEMLVREEGGSRCGFPTIVGVDERAALAHAPLTDRRLGDGETLLLVDWGARGRFYNSDLTRVLACRKISPKLEQVYGAVRQAQERAIAQIRPGVAASDVDACARAALEEAGFAQFFGHGLGHGFGLEVHEGPALRPGSKHLLEPGHVVTVEPGVYLPGWGGVRIEDDVLVTDDGCEVLTRVEKDLTHLIWPG